MPSTNGAAGNGYDDDAGPVRIQVNFRAREDEVELIRRAARADDRTVSSFSRRAAKQAAHRILGAAVE